MLKLENVSKFYYNKGMISSGFTKINLEMKIGEFIAITGESGSGKSTLLNVISGLDSYEEGEMYINGKETSHYTQKDFEDYRRKYIANIFQSFNLVNSYTVYQNVELVLLLNGQKKRDIKKRVLDIIDKVGLTKFKNTKVSKLSGGQKQRVAIARAMVKETPVIVADEPTGNLDSESAKEVIEILKKVAKDRLVIVVTHNIEQVEEYATRVIKMHDGRITEDNVIKKIEKEPKAELSKYSKMNNKNKIRLGFRNTFNIIPKFVLLFAVFLFISAAILSEYASFQMSEKNVDEDAYSFSFGDLSKKRILINKKSREQFSKEDYEKIKQITNVDYIVEDDIFLDSGISMNRNEISFFGYMNNIENFRGKLDLGRMPENENEIVLEISKDHFYIQEKNEEVLNKTFSINKPEGYNAFGNEKIKDVIIVGIKYSENDFDYNAKYYVSKNVLRELRSEMNKIYSNIKVFMNNKYEMYTIEPSNKVNKGTALVDDEFKYSYKNNKIIKEPITIQVKNIYFETELNLAVEKTYTKSNFKSLTGLEKYDGNRYKIFINEEEYKSLFDRDSYQSSVYVVDEELVEDTINELESLNINAKKATDFKITDNAIYQRIIKIIKVIVTIVLIVVLFFISYLIIKIILKSRNVYYTTLRILGATYKNVRTILDIELFLNSTIAYGTLLAFIACVKNNIFNIEYIEKLTKYVGIKEYILVYVILVLMSKLISMKFAKKVFKNSTMKTYNEEV